MVFTTEDFFEVDKYSKLDSSWNKFFILIHLMTFFNLKWQSVDAMKHI